MPIVYKWRIYCITENTFKYTWGTTAPTTCPTNVAHIVNPDSVNVVGSEETDYLAYGVTATTTVTVNANLSTVDGDYGANSTYIGTGTLAITGDTVTGIDNTIVTSNAQAAYNSFMAMSPTTTVGAINIGGLTFNPGVIALTNPGSVTFGGVTPNNRITLDGAGQYVFQVTNADLITDTTFSPVFIQLINGAKISQVYWVVNGSVNLQSSGTNTTTFKGTIISQGNITMGNNSTCNGTLAASGATSAINLTNNIIQSQQSVYSGEINVSGYKIIESSLADSKAIQILASNTFGGIYINAGIGGILVNTTNSIGLNGQAACNFTTSVGNLTLQSTVGLVNIFAPDITTGGINIGTGTCPIIIMGNTNGSTAVTLLSGTGGISLNSNGGDLLSSVNKMTFAVSTAGSDSIKLDASATGCGITISAGSGGVTSNSGTGKTQLISTNTSVDAIRLDSSGSSGGIFMASGSSGISIGNDGVAHPIVIGNTAGASSLIIQAGTGSMNIGNDSIAKQIFIGNTTGATSLTMQSGSGGSFMTSTSTCTVSATTSVNIGNTAGTVVNIGNGSTTTSVNIDSGTFGLTIGSNSANSGPIYIGNTSVGKTILIGNSNNGGLLYLRTGGSGGFLSVHQEPHTVLLDADTTLTADNNTNTGLLAVILSGTPTATRSLTVPTATSFVAAMPGVQIGDGFNFTIINKSGGAPNYTLVSNTGVTIEGNLTIVSSLTGSGSSLYRVRFTNVSSGTEAYTLYRIS